VSRTPAAAASSPCVYQNQAAPQHHQTHTTHAVGLRGCGGEVLGAEEERRSRGAYRAPRHVPLSRASSRCHQEVPRCPLAAAIPAPLTLESPALKFPEKFQKKLYCDFCLKSKNGFLGGFFSTCC
jgi:hypothetical protein